MIYAEDDLLGRHIAAEFASIEYALEDALCRSDLLGKHLLAAKISDALDAARREIGRSSVVENPPFKK